MLAIALAPGPAGADGLGDDVASVAAGHPGQSGVLLLDSGGQALRYRDAPAVPTAIWVRYQAA
ncbi:MAG: hypothetical protein ABI661_04370, partial [Gammaproteobacteria bacterium]